MELEEAIEKLNYLKTIRDLKDYVKDNNCMLADAIEVALNHLTKQEKMIDLMAEDRMLPQGCRTLYNVFNKQDVINFYERLAEESE